MSLNAFRILIVTILSVPIFIFPLVASSEQTHEQNIKTHQQLKTENCFLETLKEVFVPQIHPVPLMGGLEAPAWAVDYIENDTRGRVGGIESYYYVRETVPGHRGDEVVEISNERFKTAEGWADLSGGEWLNERLEIARSPEYHDRTESYITRPHQVLTEPLPQPGRPIRGSKIESTYAITWGEYTHSDIAGKTDAEIVNNKRFRLPEEKTLQKPVHRYLDSHGHGIAAEIRAVSKDLKTTPGWLRDDGLFDMTLKVLALSKKYPELYDKPWVTFYADVPHRELYENWIKAAIQEETTPEFRPLHVINKNGEPQLDRDWWYMELSPKTLEEVLISRAKRGRTLSNLNLPHPFKLPNGQQAIAEKGAPIAFDLKGNPTLATFRDRTKLESDIVASPKSNAYWVDQQLVRVSSIAEPYTLKRGLIEATAPAGSTLEWNSPYIRALKTQAYEPNIGDLTRPFALPPGLWENETTVTPQIAHKLASRRLHPMHEWYYDSTFVAEKNNQARLIREKRWGTPELTRMVSTDPSKPIIVSGLNFEVTQLEISPNTYVFRMAKNTPLQDGLSAAKGTDVQFENSSEGLEWSRVCLAKDTTYEGKHYKKGAVLVRLNGEVRELTSELAKQIPYSH